MSLARELISEFHLDYIHLPECMIGTTVVMTPEMDVRTFTTRTYRTFNLTIMPMGIIGDVANTYYLGVVIHGSNVIARFTFESKNTERAQIVRVEQVENYVFRVLVNDRNVCEFDLDKDLENEVSREIDDDAEEFVKTVMDDAMEPTGLSQSSSPMDLAKELVDTNFSHPSLDPTLNDRCCPTRKPISQDLKEFWISEVLMCSADELENYSLDLIGEIQVFLENILEIRDVLLWNETSSEASIYDGVNPRELVDSMKCLLRAMMSPTTNIEGLSEYAHMIIGHLTNTATVPTAKKAAKKCISSVNVIIQLLTTTKIEE